MTKTITLYVVSKIIELLAKDSKVLSDHPQAFTF